MKRDSKKEETFLDWLFPAFFFWVMLACFEAAGSVCQWIFLGTPFFTLKVAAYFLFAISFYALFCIPTAIVFRGVEKILLAVFPKAKKNFGRMDAFLLMSWGLLAFKITAIILMNVVVEQHISKAPYLLILSFMVLYIIFACVTGVDRKYYFVQWLILAFGAVFVSKGSYDLIFASPRHFFIRIFLFVLFSGVAVGSSMLFNGVLKNIFTQQQAHRQGKTRILLCTLSLAGCLFVALILRATVFYDFFPSSPKKTAVVTNNKLTPDRNAIVIVVDCLRADHLGSYGYGRQTSPFLDQLGKRGFRFENCIAASSWTIPSVVSYFTSLYPQQHGVNTFGDVIPENAEVVQNVMADHGMKTAAFITNNYLREEYGFRRGFHDFFDTYLQQDFVNFMAGNLFFLNAALYFKNEIFFPISVDPGGTKFWPTGFPPYDHKKISAESVTNDVVEWIRDHQDESFYTYIHYMDVHSPYDACWYSLYDKRIYAQQDDKDKLINVYDGRIVYVDQQIKRIWDLINEMNLDEKTMFIVTGDHGEEFYEHGGTGHCTTLYEEMIRVPFIMHVPLAGSESKVIQEQINLIDLSVTLLDFLGIKPPSQMVGRSLLPLVSGRDVVAGSQYTMSYTTRGRKSLKTEEGRKAFLEDKIWDQGNTLQGIRHKNAWKLVLGSDGREELFNLVVDPGEHSNLIREEPEIFKQLKVKLSETTSGLKVYKTSKKEQKISPEMKNKLKALGYVN